MLLNSVCYPCSEQLQLAPCKKGKIKNQQVYFFINTFCKVFTHTATFYSINLKYLCTPMTPSMVTGDCISQKTLHFHRTTIHSSKAEFIFWREEPGFWGTSHCWIRFSFNEKSSAVVLSCCFPVAGRVVHCTLSIFPFVCPVWTQGWYRP